MSDLLLELFSEEIPAGLQAPAAEALAKAIREGLAAASLPVTGEKTYYAPRRVALVLEGLPDVQPDVILEKKGPKVGANAQALEGFCRSVNLSADQLEQREVGKDTFYYAIIAQKGRPVAEVLQEVIEEALAAYVWPKSMRWGRREIRWVRPLHSMLCLLGSTVVPVRFGHITAGNQTFGHRFHAPEAITIASPSEYVQALERARVIVDADARKAIIRERGEALLKADGYRIKTDDGLLAEVANLVEWPVPLAGVIEPEFMSLPPEVLETVMKTHQRYFSVVDGNGQTAPRFLTVSNLEASDGGKAIVHGNQRVLRARLSDARFFWEQDLKHPLETRLESLKQVVFHAKVGTQYERVERIVALSGFLAGQLGYNVTQAERAARLAKADLASGMVGEFPELQGLMGRYYALKQGEDEAVANAIRDHYKPQGPKDSVPSEPASVCVAMAEKLDTLVSLFAAGEKPTGSRDPFALRRAAIGVMMIVLENGLRLNLNEVLAKACKDKAVAEELRAFFADRLKVYLREKDIRHDVVQAVLNRFNRDANAPFDVSDVVEKARALQAFLDSDQGQALLIAYRRAANILNDTPAFLKQADTKPAVERSLLASDQEIRLTEALERTHADFASARPEQGYQATLDLLASLKDPIDNFYQAVLINDPADVARTLNRRSLLGEITRTFQQIADFSQVEG